MVEKNLAAINLSALTKRTFTKSPIAWEDQVLYFLMLDRFSNGSEQGFRGNNGQPVTDGTTPLFQPADAGNAIQTDADAAAWRDAGARIVVMG